MDKDIDKGNLFMLSVDEFGILIEQFDNELNNPDKSETEIKQLLEVKINNLKTQLNQAKENKDENLVKSLIKEIQEVYKNSIVSSLIKSSKYLNNTTAAQYPVNMDEPQSLKDIGLAKKTMQPPQNGNSQLAVGLQKTENMVGKDATGVTATGLKAFSVMFHWHVTNLKSKFKNKPFEFGGVKYNIQLNEQMFEELRKDSSLLQQWDDFLTNLHSKYGDTDLGNVNLQNELLQYTKTDGVLSALLNISVDNAKELALPALNATPMTVGYYVAASAFGVPMIKVFDLMTSKVVTKMLEATDKNAFSSADFISLESLLKSSKLVDNTVIIQYEKYVEGQYGDPGGMVNKIVYKYTITDEAELEETQRFFSGVYNKQLGIYTSKDESKAIEKKLTDGASIKDIRAKYSMNGQGRSQLFNLIQLAEEYKQFGQILGLNQGLKYDAYDYFTYANKVNKTINEYIKDSGSSLTKFDLLKYLQSSDSEKEAYKNLVQSMSYNINILALIDTPHIKAQMRTYLENKQIANSYNKPEAFAETMTSLLPDEPNTERAKRRYNKLKNIYSEITVDAYINQGNTEPVEIYEFNGKTFNDKPYRLDMSVTEENRGDAHRERFLKFFTASFKAALKESFPDNEFVINMLNFTKEIQGDLQNGVRMETDMSQLDSSSKKITLDKLKSDLGKIMESDVVVKFGDKSKTYNVCKMILLYNLIQNQHKTGKYALTTLIDYKYLKDFYEFQNNLNLDFKDAKFAEELVKNVEHRLDPKLMTHRFYTSDKEKSKIKVDGSLLMNRRQDKVTDLMNNLNKNIYDCE